MKSRVSVVALLLIIPTVLVGFAASSALAAAHAEPDKDRWLIETWGVPAFSAPLKTTGLSIDTKALASASADTPLASVVAAALKAEGDKKATSAAKRKAWCDTLKTAVRMPKALGGTLRSACAGAQARVSAETQRFIALHVSHSELARYASVTKASAKTKAALAKAFLKAFSDFKGHGLVKDAAKAAGAWKKDKPHTLENAQDMAERACDAANGLSCVVAGIILEDRARGAARNARMTAKMAARRYEQACTIGDDLGCMHKALWMFRRGDAASGELAGATQQLRSSCERQHGASCHQLAQLYRHGISVKRSHEQAQRYARAGCAAGDGDSCATLADAALQARSPDPASAKAEFAKACRWGAARGCAGQASMSEAGMGTKRDLKGAFRGYIGACAAGSGVACERAATMLEAGKGTRKNVRRAWDMWARGCVLGWGLACSKLGGVLASGQKPLTAKHYRLAFALTSDGASRRSRRGVRGAGRVL